MITHPAENKAIIGADFGAAPSYSRKSYVCLKCNSTFSTVDAARDCRCETLKSEAFAETEKRMLNEKGI